MTVRSTPSMALVLNCCLIPARIARALRAGILTDNQYHAAGNEISLRIGL